MFERFSGAARRTVVVAQEEARQLMHAHIGTEHLLLGLLEDGTTIAGRTLLAAGATADGARAKVVEVRVAPGGGGAVPFSARAKRALERAERFSLQAKADEVGTAHVLRGVLDVEGTAGQILRGLGVDVVALRQAVEMDTGREARADPAPEVTVRCPSCGADLGTTLAHRTLAARGEPPRDTVVTFCNSCGTAIGAAPS